MNDAIDIKRVRITQVSDAGCWYDGAVGEIFDVVRIGALGVWAVADERMLSQGLPRRVIRKRDCELVGGLA